MINYFEFQLFHVPFIAWKNYEFAIKYRLDTEMEVSMCCSEPERPWAVVSRVKQGHY